MHRVQQTRVYCGICACARLTLSSRPAHDIFTCIWLTCIAPRPPSSTMYRHHTQQAHSRPS